MLTFLRKHFMGKLVFILNISTSIFVVSSLQLPFQSAKLTPLVEQTKFQSKPLLYSWIEEDLRNLIPGDYVFNFTDELIRGQPREFLVHVPELTTLNRKKIPIVFGLHGMGDNPENFAHGTGMNLASDTYKFLTIYPKGSASTLDSISYTWNAGTCCFSKSDDIKYLNRVMRRLIRILGHEKIDFEKIFTFGFSAGGAMSYAWACHNNGLGIDEDGSPLVKFRGIAPMSGSMANTCDYSFNSTNAFSILHFHGTNDPLFPYRYKLYLPIGYKIKTALETVTFWSSEKYQCKISSIGFHKGPVTQHLYQNCLNSEGDRVQVSLIETQRGRHSWPPVQYINASDFIWNYLNE